MSDRITGEYDSHTKDELLAESKARGIDDVTSSSLKSDIIAALALNDETAPEQPKAPLPPLKASPIPQVPKKPMEETGIDPCTVPIDEQFTDGIFTKDGEDYALCIHPSDGYGNTHSLKNSVHFWQGKEAEFNAAFKHK